MNNQLDTLYKPGASERYEQLVGHSGEPEASARNEQLVGHLVNQELQFMMDSGHPGKPGTIVHDGQWIPW